MPPSADPTPRRSFGWLLLRFLAGYILGCAIFVFGIPFALYKTAMLADQWLLIQLLPNPHWRIGLAAMLAALGWLFILWSNAFLFFRGHGGPCDFAGIAVSPRTQQLVTGGPYRYTRNPMVLGALLFYLGVAVFLDSIICAGLVIFLALGLSLYLKRVEEQRLLRQFGPEYDHYRRQVPLLFPLRFRLKTRQP